MDFPDVPTRIEKYISGENGDFPDFLFSPPVQLHARDKYFTPSFGKVLFYYFFQTMLLCALHIEDTVAEFLFHTFCLFRLSCLSSLHVSPPHSCHLAVLSKHRLHLVIYSFVVIVQFNLPHPLSLQSYMVAVPDWILL